MIDGEELERMRNYIRNQQACVIGKEDAEKAEKAREIARFPMVLLLKMCPFPVRIIKSGRATIVFWFDGSKTVVKRAESEPNDGYTAFCAALAKKIYGSNSFLKSVIKRATVEQKPRKRKEISAEEALNNIGAAFNTLVKDACPVDEHCESDNSKEAEEWEAASLNDKAKAQYEAHKQDLWVCPKCGGKYPWQSGKKGRFAFCFKCNTAGQEPTHGEQDI